MADVIEVLFLPDMHVPFHDKPTFSIAKQVLRDEIIRCKQDGRRLVLCLGGDFIDCISVSPWRGKDLIPRDDYTWETDMASGNEVLDEFEKIIKDLKAEDIVDLIYLMGNHEMWSYKYALEHKAMRDTVDPVKCMRLKERGYKIVDYGKSIKIRKMNFTHCEDRISIDAKSKKYVEGIYKEDVICAHYHGRQLYVAKSKNRGHMQGIVASCMCRKDMPYLKHRATDWTHGFNLFYLYPTKSKQYDIDTEGGYAEFNGQVYSG